MAGPNGHFRAGKNSRVAGNGINILAEEWNNDFKADEIDTTNFESLGIYQGLTGVNECDWDFKGKWNAQVNIFDIPPGIFPQDLFPNLGFYENQSDNVFNFLPFALIFSAKNGAVVRQAVTWEASGKNNGSYTLATGSV
jgi:hypothetical protein